jgi:hypothetical protein
MHKEGKATVAWVTRENTPDVVMVTNPTFDEEIRRQVQKLGLTSEFFLL